VNGVPATTSAYPVDQLMAAVARAEAKAKLEDPGARRYLVLRWSNHFAVITVASRVEFDELVEHDAHTIEDAAAELLERGRLP
jgi:hypothetical protein